MTYTDDFLRSALECCKTIAVVGFSMKPDRASHRVANYLHEQGYRVIPVNPGHAGEVIFGEPIRASLADCPKDVDMVDSFRRSEHVPPVVEEALEQFDQLKVIWMQIGVEHAQAAALAQAHGVDVIQNRCPKIEHPRLGMAHA
jgi:predicted CoA-binding protein